MFARCGKILVVLALVLSTGLHWAALQSVAWVTMLAGNLRCDAFSQAVGKTFDGRHPCCLCKAIVAGQKSEKKSPSVPLVLKMEFPPPAKRLGWFPPAQFEILPASNLFAESLPGQPLAPPPRLFLV